MRSQRSDWHPWRSRPDAARRTSRRAASTPSLFELALDFYVNPDHAGIYSGLENGRFEEAGLDVTPRVPSDPAAPIKLVAAGRADMAISYAPEVLIARDQGQPVTAVAALVATPLTSLISLPEAWGSTTPPTCAARRSPRRGSPPGSVPERDPARGADRAERGRDPERRPRPAPRRHLGPGRRDARRVPQRRGGRPRRARLEATRRPGR